MEPYLCFLGPSWNLTLNLVQPWFKWVKASCNPCLVEPLSRGTLVTLYLNTDHRKQTLVEPYLGPPRTTPQPLNNLVEPC